MIGPAGAEAVMRQALKECGQDAALAGKMLLHIAYQGYVVTPYGSPSHLCGSVEPPSREELFNDG
jgi:hypothetical protein